MANKGIHVQPLRYASFQIDKKQFIQNIYIIKYLNFYTIKMLNVLSYILAALVIYSP